MQTPTSPVNFACAQAMNAAISSCRTWMNSSVAVLARSNAPMIPLIPSPGIAVDALDAPRGEALEKVVADGFAHRAQLLGQLRIQAFTYPTNSTGNPAAPGRLARSTVGGSDPNKCDWGWRERVMAASHVNQSSADPPFLRQLAGDRLGLGAAARSRHSERLAARTQSADKVVQSICPYCAVGCGQKVFVKDEKVIQIEGDPDSPISRGRLCPKGSASEGLVNSPMRETKVKYRRPGASDWEEISLEQATQMIAERVIRTREETWEEETEDGRAAEADAGHALPRRGDARQRGELPDQEAVHGAGACRSRTRPAYDIAPRFPVWGPRSGAAAPPPSSRTCRTPTAS